MTIKFGTDGWRAVISDEFTFANVRHVAQAIAEVLLDARSARQAATDRDPVGRRRLRYPLPVRPLCHRRERGAGRQWPARGTGEGRCANAGDLVRHPAAWARSAA